MINNLGDNFIRSFTWVEKIGKGGYCTIQKYQKMTGITNESTANFPDYVATKCQHFEKGSVVNSLASELAALNEILNGSVRQGIVRCLGFTYDKDNDVNMLVFDYYDYGTLHTFCKQHIHKFGQQHIEVRYVIAYDIMVGLRYLQEQWCHNDIKCDNILIKKNQERFEGVISDFATVTEGPFSNIRINDMGTPTFLRPLEGNTECPDDIYAMGQVLIELFGGICITDVMGRRFGIRRTPYAKDCCASLILNMARYKPDKQPIIEDTVEATRLSFSMMWKHLDDDHASNLFQSTSSQPISYNDYSLGDKIGEGAYAIVYKGQYRDSSVALKQIKFHSDRILGEIQLMKKHGDQCEQLVKVKAIFNSPGPLLTMVMELCEKGSLYKVLRTENSQSLKWDTKKKIALDIAQGLGYLHSKNIVHGDLKSTNVLITTHYNAKVSDYGLAELKRTSPHKALRCKLVESTPWMAPELLIDEGIIPYSHNSDVYSFGLTLYEMATHKVPFEGTNKAELINKIINGDPEQIPFGTPGYFSAIIDECRNKDPNQRPTCDTVVNKLAIG